MRSILVCLLFISVCGYTQDKVFKPVSKLVETVSPDSIRAHIQYLADDKLLGRYPGTPGFQMAADYVIAHFKQFGIAPAGENGTYYQKVRLRRAKIVPEKSAITLQTEAASRDLVFGDDYVFLPHLEEPMVAFSAPLVFVGYGISAPEAGYDDYANIDVKGKIVVMINGSPDNFSSTVKAHTMNRGTKIEVALQKGAVGVLMREVTPRIMAAAKSMAATSGVTNVLNSEWKVFSASSRGGGGMGLSLFGLVTADVFNQMVNLPEAEMAKILHSLTQGKPSSFEMKSTLKGKFESSYTDIESFNVVGMVRGSDPVLRDEYVVHSAHLDHVGVGRPVKGDSIYNGAHDNASGVSCTLEVARLYSSLKEKPKRSVVFVMVTSEEMGLLGSSYFAAYPTVPKEKIVANVNMDMPTIIAPLLAVVPLGAQHSTLLNSVQKAAGYLKLDIEDDPEPEQNRFTRSDQYSFVEQGIPALHIKYGDKTTEPGKKLSDQVKVWRPEFYHQPQDELEGGVFDFGAGRKYVQLCFLISYVTAQENERPTWNKGDFFGERFGKH